MSFRYSSILHMSIDCTCWQDAFCQEQLAQPKPAWTGQPSQNCQEAFNININVLMLSLTSRTAWQLPSCVHPLHPWYIRFNHLSFGSLVFVLTVRSAITENPAVISHGSLPRWCSTMSATSLDSLTRSTPFPIIHTTRRKRSAAAGRSMVRCSQGKTLLLRTAWPDSSKTRRSIQRVVPVYCEIFTNYE